MSKNKYQTFLSALCAAMLLTGCAAPPETPAAGAVSQAPAPAAEEDGIPAAMLSETAAAEDDVHAAEKTPRTPESYDCHTVDGLAALAGIKSRPEQSKYHCVVDMRKDHDSYDVDWDYGSAYDAYVRMGDTDGRGWDAVFDAEYYKAAFPMLALQYHYDNEKLLAHFQTAGVHEGRQGCADFNIGAFMDWCRENRPYVSDAFQDDYAVYYLYYLISDTDFGSADFSSGDYPKQYTAVLDYAQQVEFENINIHRKAAGAEPCVYDSELAAFASYRAWVNQDMALVGHDWTDLPDSQADIDLFFDSLDAPVFSENCLESLSDYTKDWTKAYADSPSHYKAMVNEEYGYVGCSVYFVDGIAFRSQDYRGVEFDIYTRSLSTALNP